MPPRSPSWKSKYSQIASATYLADLRKNKPVRPIGSRPLPSKSSHTGNKPISRSDSTTSVEICEKDTQQATIKSLIAHSTSTNSISSQKGRPLVQAPNSTLAYQESITRQLEREEAHSLRQALEKIDFADDETKLYSAAQMEAADLVWKHLNPQLAEHEKVSAYRNPDLAKKRYVLQDEGSALDQSKKNIPDRTGLRKSSQEVASDIRLAKRGSRDGETVSNRRKSSGRHVSGGSNKGVFRNPEHQIYEEPDNLENTMNDSTARVLPLRTRIRNSLPHGSRPLPQKPHTIPEIEQKRTNKYEIWKNPPSQSRKADYAINNATTRSETPEAPETPKGRAMEIRSEEIRAATSMKKKDRSPKLPTPTAVSDRPGRPIVSFDPSWRPENQSPRGSQDIERPASRPMSALPEKIMSAPIVPTINLPEDEVSIPTINLPEQDISSSSNAGSNTAAFQSAVPIPVITLPEDTGSNIPTINFPDDEVPSKPVLETDNKVTARPLPSINHGSTSRPLPSHTQSLPPRLPPNGNTKASNSRLPWLSRSSTNSTISNSRPSAVTCTACDLPISGRIVTASGSTSTQIKARFHPECFTCHHCSTALECVSFYPEPESALRERLGLNLDSQDDPQPNFLASDLRFYCHLDYHDFFSPRCGTCKTPIEGLAILAVGKSFHEGHFFCGECGDPFSSNSPFVENKGYAYCVSCHTKRTSSRCKGCKNQILDEISVEALGGKWHESCFCCVECGGGFGDEGKFFVRDIEVELTEKERRKGVEYKKIEERAVCEECEGRRLKGWDVNAFL